MKTRDDIGKFWVVTVPKRKSILADVCFETDISGLIIQAIGGLWFEEIVVGFFRDENEAKAVAMDLLRAIKKAYGDSDSLKSLLQGDSHE